jgi:hypothetical protein
MRRHPLVVIESPYTGDVERNVAYLQRCIKNSIERGEAPFASHQMYTTALDDENEEQRNLGIECGYTWLREAHCQAFYLDHGWSRGMIEAWRIGWAMQKSYDIRFLDRLLTYEEDIIDFMPGFERMRIA